MLPANQVCWGSVCHVASNHWSACRCDLSLKLPAEKTPQHHNSEYNIALSVHSAVSAAGAFAGAVLDVLGAVSSVVAGKKHAGFVKRHTKAVVICITACMVAAGGAIAFVNKSWLDLFSLAGVLLHTSAFWIDDERIIRRVSLAGSPFWFVYNLLSRAYGSAIGDILTICSILIAMIRYKGSHREMKSV